MDDIFIRILDLTSYISSPLLHFLGVFLQYIHMYISVYVVFQSLGRITVSFFFYRGLESCLLLIRVLFIDRLACYSNFMPLSSSEDLYFGIFNGCPAVEYPSSASYHERQFTFKECPSSSNHSVATHRGTQRRLVNAKEHLCVNTGTEAGDTHGGTSLVLKR